MGHLGAVSFAISAGSSSTRAAGHAPKLLYDANDKFPPHESRIPERCGLQLNRADRADVYEVSLNPKLVCQST
jgi:hypothetical protein